MDKVYVHTKLRDIFSGYVPDFDDVFADEETFYLFAIGMVVASSIFCIILSRYIKLDDSIM